MRAKKKNIAKLYYETLGEMTANSPNSLFSSQKRGNGTDCNRLYEGSHIREIEVQASGAPSCLFRKNRTGFI